jgi:choline dehydrogenase
VLVLESGGNGDDYRDRIGASAGQIGSDDSNSPTDTPAYAYFDSLWTTPLNWAFKTTPQTNAKDREVVWPRGKVLGGSSAINGLYLNRPGEIEINAWQDMLGDMDGAEDWGWDNFLSAIKKSETFSAPLDYIATQSGAEFTVGDHGSKGPIHASYPGWMPQQNGAWNLALGNMDVPPAKSTYGGQNAGGYISTSSIDPATWKRSYSRTGYLDALPPRPNYDVLANAHVTRIQFDDKSPKNNLTATGVEYTQDGGATKKTVKVNKEVIVASGSIGSPAVLMHSGIGPKDVLDAAGVKTLQELPGVGQNLQDHLLATVYFNTTTKTPGAVWVDDSDPQRNDTMWLSFVNDAVAYLNGDRIFGDGLKKFQDSVTSAMGDSNPTGTTDKNVTAGYRAIYNTTASVILPSEQGQIELLLVTSALDGTVGITAALQHPLSHGRITIASDNPIDYPVIDPAYLTHPADVTILREGLKLARQLANTSPMKDTLTNEVTPGTDVESDADWEDWMRGKVDTEFHPSSSCAMLPLAQGGVVDPALKVYGTWNVRVADASVPPIAFSAHLVGSTYGVAETASDIIRRWWNLPRPSKETSKPKPQTSGSKGGGGDDEDRGAQASATGSAQGSGETGSSSAAVVASRPGLVAGVVLAACVALQVVV